CPSYDTSLSARLF
nr:immunoglobulin light chain junction region [Macaca mulatta]